MNKKTFSKKENKTMEELFKNKTKCTQKEYDKFLKLQIEEFGTSELIKQLLWIAFFIFCLVLSIIYKEYILLCISLLGVLTYTWFEIIRPIKNKDEQKEYTNIYKFYKYFFTIECTTGVSKIFYFKIYRVIETNTHFYIYISRENAALVSKEGFINSTPEEFKKFIHKRTMLRYKTKLEL